MGEVKWDYGILTFPGMKSSPILAPFAGTSLEFSEVVVGAIRKDSLITAVCEILSSKHKYLRIIVFAFHALEYCSYQVGQFLQLSCFRHRSVEVRPELFDLCLDPGHFLRILAQLISCHRHCCARGVCAGDHLDS